jgi:hypothetical protein
VAVSTWITLLCWAVLNYLKKDHLSFKKIILYLLNSTVFFVGVPFYVRLALIVQVPKEVTKEASMQVLKNDCILEFQNYVATSFLLCLALLFINYFFQKYIINRIEKKELLILCIIDFSILLVLSTLAIFNYYVGISVEIDSYRES